MTQLPAVAASGDSPIRTDTKPSSGKAPRPPAVEPLAMPLPPRPGDIDELGPLARRALVGGVLAAHLLGGWALLQVDAVRQAVVEAAPIMVSLIAPPEPPKPAPPPPPKPQMRKPDPVPVIAAAPSLAPAPPAFVAPPPEPAPVVAQALAAPPAPPAPPAAPLPPPGPKSIAPSAVRYLVEPKMTVPLLSRRLGEQGVVQLRIVVDARGLLKQASIRKSSGFARLDEQALHDIRSARFAPYTENGQPIEWETTAVLAYELDR